MLHTNIPRSQLERQVIAQRGKRLSNHSPPMLPKSPSDNPSNDVSSRLTHPHKFSPNHRQQSIVTYSGKEIVFGPTRMETIGGNVGGTTSNGSEVDSTMQSNGADVHQKSSAISSYNTAIPRKRFSIALSDASKLSQSSTQNENRSLRKLDLKRFVIGDGKSKSTNSSARSSSTDSLFRRHNSLSRDSFKHNNSSLNSISYNASPASLSHSAKMQDASSQKSTLQVQWRSRFDRRNMEETKEKRATTYNRMLRTLRRFLT